MMMQDKIKEIRDLLMEVKYPGSSKNVVELDMVQHIRIEEEKVFFRLVFQKSNDPFVGAVKKKCETLLKEKTVYQAVEIETVFVHDLERPLSLEKVKNIIAVSSGKGGVGKSTVAANLAVALAMQGYKVGLVDADIFGPSIPKMFGCEDARPCIEKVGGQDMIVPIEKYGVKILSIGFFVDPASATVWRGPMASNALKQLVEQGYWEELDYMLIDLPPGTSDIHLTLVQTVALTGALVVSTPQEVALADAIKGINMFDSPGIEVPVLGLVENMAWFTPAELPDHRYYIFGKEGAKRLAEEKGLRLLGQIPVVQSICEGGDSGKPVALNPDSITGAAFMELAGQVVEAVEEGHSQAKRVRITKK
ncbi:MAG: Mrp/NBP35 family ATP-binding protein [Odoribacter sp.]